MLTVNTNNVHCHDNYVSGEAIVDLVNRCVECTIRQSQLLMTTTKHNNIRSVFINLLITHYHINININQSVTIIS